MENSYVIDFWRTLFLNPGNNFSDIVMFDRASNVQLGEKLPKFHYPKLLVMYGVEHTMSFLFNDISKIIIVHQIISSHKKMYNILILVYIISQIRYLN